MRRITRPQNDELTTGDGREPIMTAAKILAAMVCASFAQSQEPLTLKYDRKPTPGDHRSGAVHLKMGCSRQGDEGEVKTMAK